ncbi:PRC-barrel domain-containing protein [Oculatella sp. LEGE 06141]|uniref:PRC-barrel domain-containing protein n=1 Tax=Oculatella sp. LEGE 06141 TaxID=1828648 RepID=UPI00187F923E|nr:PRC-barrel domain-containing protein [Oculatella sp. LEGE 06141]MBE9179735.1 PRC-barrel domain-containing protein [Oculatella sp. LEGE 06141]
MAIRPEVIRQSDLINQLVLDRTTLEELGRVEVLWMYPQAHRVLGFICKSGLMGAKKTAFKLAQIEALGANGVLTHSQPEETDAGKVRQLESLLNRDLWSDAGNQLGKITDCLFNVQTGEITQYLFLSNGWSGIAGDIYQLPPDQISSIGRSRLLVAESSVQTFTVFSEGLQQKLNKARAALKDDYLHLKQQTLQELQAIAQDAQTRTEQAKGQFQTLAERAREQAQRLSQQAKERLHTLNEQLQEDAQTLAKRAKESSQDFTEQVRERTHLLNRQVEEGIQTLTVHAEEIFERDVTPSPEPPLEPPSSLISEPPPPQPDPFAANPFVLDDDPWILEEIDREADPNPEPTSEPPLAVTNQATVTEAEPSAVDDDDDDEPWI